MKNFFTWFMAFPSIVCLILLGCYRFQLAGQAEWITLITAWIGSTATIMLGVIVFYQTENHKKRQEEDNKLYQEQAEKNRQQDLMIRANPHATFTTIDCVRYAQGSMMLSKGQTYNRLTNIDFEDFHCFQEHVYMDLTFNAPPNNVLERVYIKSVTLKCYKGEFAGGNFEEIASYDLRNYSSDENISNIKINSCGSVNALLSLLFDTGNEEIFYQNDIKKLLDNDSIKWAISIYYTLSNSFKIEIDYKTHMNFILGKGIVDDYGDISYDIIKPTITTTQTSNIKIKDDNQ